MSQQKVSETVHQFYSSSDGIEITVAALNGFKHAPGPRLQKFLSEIPIEPSECFYFKEQRVSDTTAQRQVFQPARSSLLTN